MDDDIDLLDDSALRLALINLVRDPPLNPVMHARALLQRTSTRGMDLSVYLASRPGELLSAAGWQRNDQQLKPGVYEGGVRIMT